MNHVCAETFELRDVVRLQCWNLYTLWYLPSTETEIEAVQVEKSRKLGWGNLGSIDVHSGHHLNCIFGVCLVHMGDGSGGHACICSFTHLFRSTLHKY